VISSSWTAGSGGTVGQIPAGAKDVVAAAFAEATVTYLTWGDVSLSGVLGNLEEVRQATP
jgi:hypothetical protein